LKSGHKGRSISTSVRPRAPIQGQGQGHGQQERLQGTEIKLAASGEQEREEGEEGEDGSSASASEAQHTANTPTPPESSPIVGLNPRSRI
jgi:hypothetical protein